MNQKNQTIKLMIFFISCVGTFGSLYFSEIMKLPPCSLCWYQRVFLYPIAIVTLVHILKNKFDDLSVEFVLATLGFMVALYHNLLYYGFIENIVPCTQGVSCTSRQIEWFGFVTIPFLSLLAFTLILTAVSVRYISKEKISHVNK